MRVQPFIFINSFLKLTYFMENARSKNGAIKTDFVCKQSFVQQISRYATSFYSEDF